MLRCVLLLVCLCINNTVLCYDNSELYGEDDSQNISCTVRPDLTVSKLRLEKYIADGNNLIRLNISVHWNNIPLENESYPVNIEWFMTTKESGKRLLLLDRNFENMSLRTLSPGVVKLAMTLLQDPVDCLSNVSALIANATLFHSLLTLLINNETASERDMEEYSDLAICNGYEEEPVCCKLSLLGTLNCEQHIRDNWVDFLYKVVKILLFLSVSYSPCMFPKSWYKKTNNVFLPGVRAEIENSKTQLHKLEHSLVIEVTDRTKLEGYTRVIDSINSNTGNSFDFIYKMKIQTDIGNFPNARFRLNLRLKNIIAESEQLLSEITTSSGLSQFFSRLALFFIQVCFTCKIRHEDCLRKMCHKTLCHTCYIFTFCGNAMKILFSLVFWVPAILRCIYLKRVYPARDYTNLYQYCLILTIVTVGFVKFVLVIFEMKGMKTFLADCLNNVLDLSMAKRAKNVKKILRYRNRLLECCGTECALCKMFAWFTVLCFSIIYVCASFLPYYHLICVLFFEGFLLIDHKLENYLCASSCYYSSVLKLLFLILIAHLLLIPPFIVLLDTIAFYLLCFIYVILGLIVNSSIVLPFITSLLLMCSYIYNTLQDTHKKIDNFKNALIKTLAEHNATLFKNAYMNSYRSHQNTVSFLKPKGTIEKVSASQDGTLRLVTNNLLLFHKIDPAEKIPYLLISDFFLHKMLKYPSRITPGSIYKLYIRNFRDICVMFVILSIMLFAILGFGQAHELTAGVQSLVTVGSGIVLFVFNNLLSRSRVDLVDDNGLHLKTIVKEVLKRYTESWEIKDYNVEKQEEAPENIRADIIVQIGLNANKTFFVNTSVPETDIDTSGITDSDDSTDGCSSTSTVYDSEDHSSSDNDEL